ncbi:MAG: hypothetical protein WCT29_02425 [Candidatus Paceibacterota bacterium]|jgi:hypothetical protein
MPSESYIKSFERKPEKSKALSEFLDKVDFDSLRQILSEYVKASGLTLDETLFMDKDKIIDTTDGVSGYFTEDNVALNMKIIRNYAMATLSPVDYKALKTLCHEEVHAISQSNCEEMGEGNWRFQGGYGVTYINDKNEGSVYVRELLRLFDEGVTEKLGREVTKKYLALHPSFVGKWQGIPFETSYQQPVELIDVFIIRLSKELELSEETVWHAILRSKIEGGDFFEKEVQDMFEAMFGAEFVLKLFKANNIKDIRELTKIIENSSLVPQPNIIDKIKRQIYDIGYTRNPTFGRSK